MAVEPPLETSYRALLQVPSLGRVLISMQIARICQSMVGVAMIWFALFHFRSAPLAGAVAFAALTPGLVLSPIAGALLDRHGRIRLVMIDYVIAASGLVLTGSLSLAGALQPWMLLAIAVVSGATNPLSTSGIRSLFPLIVPKHLWERANAVDSNGWLLATVVAAPMAGTVTAWVGFEPTFFAMAAGFLVAVVLVSAAPDPRTDVVTTGNLLRDAWQGLVYTWRNPTLRALAVSLSTFNLALGMLEIFLPAILLVHFGFRQDVVGWLFCLQGLAGIVSAFAFGRVRTEGREKAMIGLPVLATGFALALFLVPGMWIWPIVLAMALAGLLNGPLDIAMFTLRQRRTDAAWMGRAFTVSMSLNFAGFPIGTALAGQAVGASIDGTIVAAVAIAIVSGALALALIPRGEPATEPELEPTRQPV